MRYLFILWYERLIFLEGKIICLHCSIVPLFPCVLFYCSFWRYLFTPYVVLVLRDIIRCVICLYYDTKDWFFKGEDNLFTLFYCSIVRLCTFLLFFFEDNCLRSMWFFLQCSVFTVAVHVYFTALRIIFDVRFIMCALQSSMITRKCLKFLLRFWSLLLWDVAKIVFEIIHLCVERKW